MRKVDERRPTGTPHARTNVFYLGQLSNEYYRSSVFFGQQVSLSFLPCFPCWCNCILLNKLPAVFITELLEFVMCEHCKCCLLPDCFECMELQKMQGANLEQHFQ